MNKQELIDKAVDEWLYVGALVRGKANKQVLTVDHITEDNGVSCSNFKAYCLTELEPCGNGWVNGYRYGVEYETNGKKPDLPGDLNVIVKYERYGWRQDNDGTDIVEEWVWGPSVAFKIVDERYKPKETPMFVNCTVENKRDYGIAVTSENTEVKQAQDKSSVEVNGYALLGMLDNLSDDEMVWFQQSDEAKSLLKLLTNRKADEEKRAFVERVISVIDTSHSYRTAAGDMYDEGCRFK